MDARGTVRASLKVEPGGECVFRLRDATGAIRVKLGADTNGSGLVLMDSATEPGIQALAKDGRATVKLTNQGGAQKSFEPSSRPAPGTIASSKRRREDC